MELWLSSAPGEEEEAEEVEEEVRQRRLVVQEEEVVVVEEEEAVEVQRLHRRQPVGKRHLAEPPEPWPQG